MNQKSTEIKRYLEELTPSVSTKHIKLFFLFIWSCLTIYTLSNHELWRDEMRALSIATLNDSIFELIVDLKNEGHPILWYLMLKFSYWIYPHTVVIKILSFLISFISVFLVLFFIRLPLFTLICFIFSNLMVWEYTIMCRNYGISALLIILFTILYQRRMYFICFILLALLIQTNLIGAIVAFYLFVYLMVENFKKIKFINFLTGLLLIIGSYYLFYIVTKPNELSYVAKLDIQNIFQNKLSILNSFLYPSNVMNAFMNNMPFLCSLIIFAFTFILLRKPILAFLFYSCAVLLNFLSIEFYILCTRHIGVFIVFLFFCYYQIYQLSEQPSSKTHHKLMHFGARFLIPSFFFGLMISAFIFVIEDNSKHYSNSENLSNFIKLNKKYTNAILMSEPDLFLEPIPYYLENKMYFPRENKFKKYSSFTRLNKDSMSLSNYIFISDSLKSIYHEPVLILIHKIDFLNPKMQSQFPVYITKILTWKHEDLNKLKKLKVFENAICDENYTLYEIL